MALWRDEFASRDFASLPVGRLFTATGHVDAVFTPYYLLLHLWAAVLGTSAVALRLPSVLAGVATVLVVSCTVQRMWGRAAGLTAGLALALNPLFYTGFIQARPYALCLLACTGATALLLGVDLTRRRRVAYGVLMTLAVALQVFGVLVLLAHLAVVVGRARHELRRFLVAAVVPVVVAAALLAVGRSQQGQVSWVDPVGPFGTVRLWLGLAGSTSAGLLALAATVVALVHRRDALLRVGMATWVVPAAVLAAVSLLVEPVLVPRYLVAGPLGVAVVLAAGAATATASVARLGGPTALRAVVAAGTVLLVAVTTVPALRSVQQRPFPDWRPVAAALTADLTRGDLIEVRQEYYEVGLASGLATFTGDVTFAADAQSDLLHGAPALYRREVTGTSPLRTAPFSTEPGGVVGRDVTVVGVVHDLPAGTGGTGTRPDGCSATNPDRPVEVLSGGDAYVASWSC